MDFLHEHDVSLRCPRCGHGLGIGHGRALACTSCGSVFPVIGGIPNMHRGLDVRGADRFMRRVYDSLGALHDAGVRHVLPFVEGTSEQTLRRRVVAWMELDRVDDVDGCLKILEVGIGTGANLEYMAAALAPGRDALVWGVDLSRTMLTRCRRRAALARLEVRLALADAHALPFEDDVFDRVLHIGGIGSFGDPSRALAEMARVAKPGAPIVVADEELDRRSRPGLMARATFGALTFNQPRPSAPIERLPPSAIDVEVGSLSAFYYVIRFREGG